MGSTPLCMSNKYEQLSMGHVSGDFAMREKREHLPTQNTCQTVGGISESSLEGMSFLCFSISSHWISLWRWSFSKNQSQEYNNWDKHSWIPSWCLQSWAVKSTEVVPSHIFFIVGDQLVCCSEPEHQIDICFLLLALTMILMSNFRWYWNQIYSRCFLGKLWTFADLPYLEAQMFSSVLRSSAPTILEGTFQRHTAAFQELNHRLRLEIMAFLKRTLWHTLLWAPRFVCHILLFKEIHHDLFTPWMFLFVRTLQTLISNCLFLRHIAEEARNCDLLVLWLDCDRTDLGV